MMKLLGSNAEACEDIGKLLTAAQDCQGSRSTNGPAAKGYMHGACHHAQCLVFEKSCASRLKAGRVMEGPEEGLCGISI
jgi:hypothetical protein